MAVGGAALGAVGDACSACHRERGGPPQPAASEPVSGVGSMAVHAAADWGGYMERKRVRPGHELSYEALCHESGVPAFLLHLREPRRPSVRAELMNQRLERAIGVIYRPETELASHYFEASLPRQFDEYVWIDETRAIEPLEAAGPAAGEADTFPFGV